jgi:hypothetical protein
MRVPGSLTQTATQTLVQTRMGVLANLAALSVGKLDDCMMDFAIISRTNLVLDNGSVDFDVVVLIPESNHGSACSALV